MKIPKEIWYGRFSREHPELVLDVVNVVYTDRGEVDGEFEVNGSSVDWTSAIGVYPDVIEVETLEFGFSSGRYRVRFRQSKFSHVWRSLDFLARFPRTVVNGSMTSEAIAWKSRLASILDTLSAIGVEPRLLSLRRVPGRKNSVSVSVAHSDHPARLVTMTPVQRGLFRQAMVSGYFDVPRRITVTELAKKVSRTKSSVSVMLCRVERSLADSAAQAGA
ncbi:MAG: helix-turn-helix domain-containing protein [Thermoplasmata archaeon]|jgi:hypothetical protein